MAGPVIGVLGAGGQGREVAEFSPAPVAFFAVDAEYADIGEVDGIGVLDFRDAPQSVPVVAAIGTPGLRRRLVEQWCGMFTSVISPASYVAKTAAIGLGSMVAPGAVVMSGAVLGEHSLINAGATIGHDTVIGEYATLCPGVNVAGSCHIGAGVFLGIGSAVSHRVRIGEGVIVGAGAVVLEDLESGYLYVGAPARQVRRVEGWLREL